MIHRAISIYRDNRSTFYDYRTNRAHSIKGRTALFLAFSAALAFLIQGSANDLLDAVITVQSILIGFSFSVMFFLVQTRNKEETNNKSIEEDLRQEQISLLSKELFWNISYFNLTALSSLIMAVALLMPNVWGKILTIADSFSVVTSGIGALSAMETGTYYLAKFLFFVLFIESTFTFLRTVGRVNFLFEERMKLLG